MPVAYSSEEGPLSKSRNYKLAVEICVGESLKVHKKKQSVRAAFFASSGTRTREGFAVKPRLRWSIGRRNREEAVLRAASMRAKQGKRSEACGESLKVHKQKQPHSGLFLFIREKGTRTER